MGTEISSIIVILSGIIGALGAAYFSVAARASRKEVEQTTEKVKQAEKALEDGTDRAKPAWDLARGTLELYWQQNRRQGNYVFTLSVAIIVVGFSIMVTGFFLASRSTDAAVVAAIAGAAGVITEFIGATLLLIYRSIVSQAVTYSKTLERINSVGMAMQVVESIPDAASSYDLKSKTRSDLVALIIRQAYYSHDEPFENDKKAQSESASAK